MKMRKSLLGLALITMALSSCGKSNDKTKPSTNNTDYIKTSMEIVTGVNASVIIEDGGINVYEYVQNVTFDEDNTCTRETTTKTLADGFKFSENTTKDKITSVDRNSLFRYNLSKDNFSDYSNVEGNITGKVSKENFVKVFKVNADVNGEADFELLTENEKISKITCTYSTSDLKNVSIEINYLY